MILSTVLNRVPVVKFSVLNCSEMDVVREVDYFQTKVTLIYRIVKNFGGKKVWRIWFL